ncbi:hypothetical protein Droror1_Dr00021412 [Drosera rotundifolia]
MQLLATREMLHWWQQGVKLNTCFHGESGSQLTRILILEQGCSLEEFPQGYMGKMLVYKSGKVKPKLGEALFDVSRGPGQCDFPEDVAVINRNAEHCTVSLGKSRSRLL